MLFLAALYALSLPQSGLCSLPTQQPIQIDEHSQGYHFDALLHLPGTSPYFDAVGFGLEHSAPWGCKVTAASYLVRHGAIHANDAEYEAYIQPLLFKLEEHRGGFSGPLEFLNQWHSPIDEDHLEDLTPSGATDAGKVGKHILDRYPHLVPSAKRILADKKARTHDTARAFISSWPNASEIEIVKIKKHTEAGKALIPHKMCSAFNKTPGTKELHEFCDNYAPYVIKRLTPYLPPEIKLENKDILGMQAICGYESAIHGKRSPICNVFTDAEWMAYEYAWDLKYAYMVGPLNKLSPYLGFPWLKTQTDLFSKLTKNEETGDGWPEGQRFFLSFTHREVPPFVATALGIFNSSSQMYDEFPTTHVNWARAWKMSDLIPFLGHVGMEIISCDGRPGKEGDYIRFIANTAPRPLPLCQNGPGASCAFEDFKRIIADGAAKYADFDGVCKNK